MDEIPDRSACFCSGMIFQIYGKTSAVLGCGIPDDAAQLSREAKWPMEEIPHMSACFRPGLTSSKL